MVRPRSGGTALLIMVSPAPVGTFGKACGNHCSSHCRNRTCNPTNGSCLEGCSPGYLGNFCNKPCDRGTYRINCSQNCSRNCHGACDNVDGSCTCSSGWTGSPYCNEKADIVNNVEYHNSNPDAYIAALSISLVINVMLVVVIVILSRVLYHRKQEKLSSNYVTSAEILPPSQASDNDVHQYQDLNMPNESSYQNLSLRDRS